MTAEIAVMNRLGIALAADSAVTVGPDARKIYSSAEKLFMLTPAAPVGAMVYDSADLLGVPWETVIKVFYQRHGSVTPPTLAEYAKLFREYLASSRELFPGSAQAEFVGRIAFSYYGYLVDLLGKQIDLKAGSSGKVSDGEIRLMLATMGESWIRRQMWKNPRTSGQQSWTPTDQSLTLGWRLLSTICLSNKVTDQRCGTLFRSCSSAARAQLVALSLPALAMPIVTHHSCSSLSAASRRTTSYAQLTDRGRSPTPIPHASRLSHNKRLSRHL
jgi:hypothetical protein